MRKARSIASLLWAMAALAMLVAGPVLLYQGVTGQRDIRQELSAQKIQFPPAGDADLPPSLSEYAGQEVTTGPQARAYADLIRHNVTAVTGGETYAQVAERFGSSGGGNDQLNQVRQIAFMGESLRGSLLSAYSAWQLAWLTIVLGSVMTGLAFVFGATSLALRDRRVPAADAEAPETPAGDGDTVQAARQDAKTPASA